MDSVKTIEKIFSENDEGKLVLPNFQRGFEWKVEDQKKLLSTVLSLLPIGSILLLEGKKGDFATRQLCYNDNDFEQQDECLYLLDGQQRTSTLRALFSNLLGDKNDWEANFDKLYKDLRYRWFIDLKKRDLEDIFGYEKLRIKDPKKFEPGQFLECIVGKKIQKKDKANWYHPAFDKDESGNPLEGSKLKVAIAKKASEEGLIPLYEVYNARSDERKSVLYYVLETIASDRLKELKASVDDGDYTLKELLEPVSADIEEHIENKDIESIASAWSTLASDWKKDMMTYLINILDQKMHVIQLPSNEISRATAIYEDINKGGISLNAYDLIVAKAARLRTERTLTQTIIELLESEIELPAALLDTLKGNPDRNWSSKIMDTVADNKLSVPIRDQFLNLLSIFSHTEYGEMDSLKIDIIKKDKQLGVTSEQIKDNAEITIKSLIRAYAFLQYRCGKINVNNLNHKLMLLPIAYVLRVDSVWESKASIAKIEYWYWASLFGGYYREKQNQRCIEDIKELYAWLNGSRNPFENRVDRILNYEGYSSLNVLLNQDDNTTPSAIQNGILEYVLSNQPSDFIPNKEILLSAWDIAVGKEICFDDNLVRKLKIENHHIYPLGADLSIEESSKEIRRDSSHILNSPLNRTFITDYSNGLIKAKSPEQYFGFLPNLTTLRHAIDTLEWKEKAGETSNERHVRVLTNRHKKLKDTIEMELDNLKHIH